MGYFHFEEVFNTLRYPAGESHVRVADGFDLAAVTTLEVQTKSFEDLGNLVTASRVFAHQRLTPQFFLPYFPFARHDRRSDSGDGLELQVALELVRQLDITIADPHSDVTGVLRHVPQAAVVALFERCGAFQDDPVVVIPDQGATKKAYSWLGKRTVVQASKKRDMRTGALSGFSVASEDLNGRACIIVDDICDGGGTFLGLATELQQRGAGSLTLAVTHGLFTQGLERLSESFGRIYCCAPRAREEGTLSAIPYRDLFEQGVFV